MYDRDFKPNFFSDITKAARVHILARFLRPEDMELSYPTIL
jgi:hypothetical protein